MKKIYYLHQKYGSRQHYCLDEHNRLVPLCEVRFTKICPYAVAMENRLWHCADDLTLTPVIDCSEQDIQHISDQTGKKLLLVRHKLFSITDKAIIPMDDKTYAAGKTLLTVCGQIYRIGGGPLISSTFKRDSYKLVSALNDGSGEYFVCTEDACTFLDSNCKIVGDVIFTSRPTGKNKVWQIGFKELIFIGDADAVNVSGNTITLRHDCPPSGDAPRKTKYIYEVFCKNRQGIYENARKDSVSDCKKF